MEGEEDIMVSHLESFRYVEVRGEIDETPFQAFEVVNMVMTPPMKESKKGELPMASWKNVKTVIETGHPEGWGRVLELPVIKDRSEMGTIPIRGHQGRQ